jgi:hypothetical protein
MTEARTVIAEAALGASYQIVLDKEARRTLVFQAHVTVATPIEQVNELLDKIATAADRQIAIYELRQAQADLEGQERTMASLERQMANMEELSRARWEAETTGGRKRGEWTPERLQAQERQAHGNIKVSLERYREGMQRAMDTIERCKQTLGEWPCP